MGEREKVNNVVYRKKMIDGMSNNVLNIRKQIVAGVNYSESNESL